MKRFRIWLIEKFLPAWAKDSVYRENLALREEIVRIKAENARLNAYIDGLEDGIRTQRRIVINNEVKR